MADPVRAKLVHAYNLIKEGKKQDAESVLIDVLRAHPDNADAWWLMANALTDPDEQREALQEVLQLRPGDEKARKLLDKINTLHPPKPAPQAAEPDDPFADLLNDSPTSDPFTGNKGPKPSSAAFSAEDPFAVFDQPSTPAKSSASPDPFSDDDPFAIVDQPKSQAARRPTPPASASGAAQWQPREEPKKKGANPILIVLAVVGALALCVCAGLVFVLVRGAQQVLADPTFSAIFNDPTLIAAVNNPNAVQTLQAGGFSFQGGSARLPDDLNMRGSIRPGLSERATVDTFTDDGWLLELAGGATVTVEVQAMDGQLDPQLFVYGADNQLVASNDDIDMSQNNLNSRVTFAASQGGVYTLVISAFGQGGSYMLVVR
jgi:hypothetical protein